MPRPAVFLDRDGTLNREVNYLADPADLELIPGCAGALESLRASGFALVVATNQSGIARGLLTEERLRVIHSRLEEMLGLRFDFARNCWVSAAIERDRSWWFHLRLCQLLDWYSRKHSRVVWSTYAAELLSILDAVGQDQVLVACFDKVACIAMAAAEILDLRADRAGVLKHGAVVDARGVFDSVTADQIKPPSDRHLQLRAQAFCE